MLYNIQPFQGWMYVLYFFTPVSPPPVSPMAIYIEALRAYKFPAMHLYKQLAMFKALRACKFTSTHLCK